MAVDDEICPICGFRLEGAYDVKHGKYGHVGYSKYGSGVIAVTYLDYNGELKEIRTAPGDTEKPFYVSFFYR